MGSAPWVPLGAILGRFRFTPLAVDSPPMPVRAPSPAVLLAGDNLCRLHGEFASRHSLHLPRFLTGAALRHLVDEVADARFCPERHLDAQAREFSSDLTIAGADRAVHLFHFVLNDPDVLELVRRITGCEAVRSFSGRIYRMLPGTSDHLSWHDDNATSDRLVGISINLSQEPYHGGRFQLRDKGSRLTLNDIANTGLGDAVLFRIAAAVEHRVTWLEGTVARTAAAGWFTSGRGYLEAITRGARAAPL